MTTLRDKSVLILGLGETGLSLARYLHAQGARLRVADSRDEPPGVATLRSEMPQAEVHCGMFNDALLQGVDRIAISPGVPLAEPFVQRAVAHGIPVEGDIELLAQEIANKFPDMHARSLSPTLSPEGRGGDREKRPLILAITGANGKTTTTSMVGAMCAAAGLDAQVAGNISPAVLDALRARGGHQPQVWVLELSSFQLETTHTLDADAAVVLNVSEDHLDRYANNMDLYAAAKTRVFNGHGVQVLNRDDARSAAMGLAGRRQVTFGLTLPGSELDWGISRDGAITWLMQGAHKVMRADELQVTGLHNVANALAALALCRALELPLLPLVAALRAFKGLPHRVQEVAQVNGITYYDDSKGTNVGATVAALNGLGKKAVVILGGDGKGQDFSPLKPAVEAHARAVVLIGRDATLIASAIAGCGKPVLNARDMNEAVRIAAANAQSGDAVLMSPACASFDMYRNYLHRAQVFIAAVEQLKTEVTC